MGNLQMRPPPEPQTIDQIPHSSFFPRKPVAWDVCNRLLLVNGLHLNPWASFPKNTLYPGKIKCTPTEPHAKPFNSETRQAKASMSMDRERVRVIALRWRRDEKRVWGKFKDLEKGDWLAC